MLPERIKELNTEAKQELEQERLQEKFPKKRVSIQSTAYPADYNKENQTSDKDFNRFQLNIRQQLLSQQVGFNYQEN